MFINKTLQWVQNSKTADFVANSLIFENIDKLAFVFLVLTIVSTAFMPSGTIGISAAAFVICCLFKLFFKKGESVKLSFINKILILYLFFVFISLAGATLFALSLKGIIKTLIYIAFYFSAAYFLSDNKKKIFFLIFTIAGLTCIEAVIGILQNTSHVEAISTWQDTSYAADPALIISRAYGTLRPFNPNLLAGYLLAGLSSVFVFLGGAYLKRNSQGVIISAIFLSAVCFAIFATGSRGAYLGLFGIFITIIFYVFAIFKRHRTVCTGFLSICIIAICFIPSFTARILSIFSFRGDSSISFRMNVYEACTKMFWDNKFLGIGVGNKNFREIYGLYMKTGYDALGAYCVPLEIAIESGIFALLAFASYIISAAIRCVKYTLNRHIHPLKRVLIFSVLLTIVAVMFHGFFDTIFFRPQVQILFWTNMAIFHALTISNKFCNAV